MGNREVANLLNRIADLLEVTGESRFRVTAYRAAARRIEQMVEDVGELARDGRLEEIQGIGPSIATKIDEYLATGRIGYLEELAQSAGPGFEELLQVPGLGPKRAMALRRALGVGSLADLERALGEGEVERLPGFSPTTVDKLRRELKRLRERTRRLLLGVALPAAEEVVGFLEGLPEVLRIAPAGSIRRACETIGDIDILVASEEPRQVMRAFVSMPVVAEVIAAGDTKGSILTRDGLQIDVRIVAPSSWGAALQYFTGSKAHNIKLRTLASHKGLKVNEYGVFEEASGRRLAGAEEGEVYWALGLPWIPPELREDRGEVEAALRGELPDLVGYKEICGDLHVHTSYSDGLNTIEEMAGAAQARGYQYLAISDHSKGLAIAGGLTAEKLLEQQQHIRRLNRKLAPFRILAGVEANIRADGTLDYEDAILARCDLVIASVHSALGQPKERMTRRIVRAMENPYVHIIGHPSGRLIGRRDPYEVDLPEIFRAAARTNTALEVNSMPDRLDLDDKAIRASREYGVKLVITTDAHGQSQLDLIRYGIATARRGWAEKSQILNAQPLERLLSCLWRKKGAGAATDMGGR